MGDGEAVVNFMDQYCILRKFPCKQLAKMGEDDGTVVPISYCPKLQKQAIVPFRCSTPVGDLTSNFYPNAPPTVDANNNIISNIKTNKRSNGITITNNLLVQWKFCVSYLLGLFFAIIA
jgi:hypothetical protein